MHLTTSNDPHNALTLNYFMIPSYLFLYYFSMYTIKPLFSIL